MTDRLRSTGRLLLVLACMTIVAACNTSHVTKPGAPVEADRKALTMFVPQATDPEADYFTKEVDRLSAGRLHVEIDSSTYNDSDPHREKLVVGGLRAGEADLGFVSGREWAQAGQDGFAAIQTPFVITTLPAAIAAAQSSIATDALKDLSSIDIVGLAIVPGEPRQLLTTSPIFESDLGGSRIRIVDNDQVSALIKALGGTPIEHLTSREVGPLLRSGQLEGVESAPIYVLNDSYSTSAHYLSSYGMFPKVNAIVASRSAWQGLDDQQRAVLGIAATNTREEAATALPQRALTELTKLCNGGVVIDSVGLATLHVLAERAKSAASGNDRVSQIAEQLRRDIAEAGPQPLAFTLPSDCKVAHSAAQARALAAGKSVEPIYRGGSTIPPGTYVTTDTVADFHAGGQYGTDWDKDLVTTNIFYPDGRFLTTQQPDYPDQGPLRGTYAVHGDTLTITFEASSGELPEVTKWSYYNGELTFSIVDVPDTASRVIYLAHPWRRVR